jgi:hypothetical protein
MEKILIGVIGVMGVIGSVWEYKNWKVQETSKYGQGWEQTKTLKEPETLIGPYVSKDQKFRIRYPKNWEVLEDKNSTTFFFNSNSIRITQVKTGLNFADFVDSQSSGVTRDRDYIDSLVILTFTGRQKALTQKDNKIYLVEATTPPINWNEYELTFKEVYKSLTIF